VDLLIHVIRVTSASPTKCWCLPTLSSHLSVAGGTHVQSVHPASAGNAAQGERQHIMAMTNKSVGDLVSDREITNAETVN